MKRQLFSQTNHPMLFNPKEFRERKSTENSLIKEFESMKNPFLDQKTKRGFNKQLLLKEKYKKLRFPLNPFRDHFKKKKDTLESYQGESDSSSLLETNFIFGEEDNFLLKCVNNSETSS